MIVSRIGEERSLVITIFRVENEESGIVNTIPLFLNLGRVNCCNPKFI